MSQNWSLLNTNYESWATVNVLLGVSEVTKSVLTRVYLLGSLRGWLQGAILTWLSQKLVTDSST